MSNAKKYFPKQPETPKMIKSIPYADRVVMPSTINSEWKPSNETPFDHIGGIRSIIAVPETLDKFPTDLLSMVAHLSAAAFSSSNAMAAAAATDLLEAVLEIAERSGDDRYCRVLKDLVSTAGSIAVDMAEAANDRLQGEEQYRFDYDDSGTQKKLNSLLFELGRVA